MIEKSELEKIIRLDLIKLLNVGTFYHYTKFDIAIDEILLKQTLLFSTPETFNDPFDCNEKLFKINFDDFLVDEVISNYSNQISRQERRKFKRDLKDPKTLSNILIKERNKFKIACFSEINNEILMWSHYADKHSGICIGFNFPPKYEEKFILSTVKYIDQIKPMDGKADVERVILYWLTSKSIRWNYEQEIRAITKTKSQDNHELIHFDSKYIKEIIFGCNVTDKKVNYAISKIKHSSLDLNKIEIKRMRIDESNFLLKVEKIKPGT